MKIHLSSGFAFFLALASMLVWSGCAKDTLLVTEEARASRSSEALDLLDEGISAFLSEEEVQHFYENHRRMALEVPEGYRAEVLQAKFTASTRFCFQEPPAPHVIKAWGEGYCGLHEESAFLDVAFFVDEQSNPTTGKGVISRTFGDAWMGEHRIAFNAYGCTAIERDPLDRFAFGACLDICSGKGEFECASGVADWKLVFMDYSKKPNQNLNQRATVVIWGTLVVPDAPADQPHMDWGVE